MIDVEAITMISIFLFPLLSATILLLGYLNYRWLKIKIWKCFSQAFLLFLIATGITPMMYFTSNPTTIFIPFFGALPGLLGVVASAIYIISFLFIISFIKGAIKAVAPSAAAAAAAAAAGGEISLLRDDILAVRGYGAMTNIVLASARPAIGDKPLRESLTEYFEYNPLLFEGCKIKDDGAINTEPLIKNLDRISGENRVQMVCSAFSALNSKIMNLYGAVTSPDLAEKALGVSYLTAKKQYSDLPVFFDILRSLPEGVLEEERLALLSREELGVRVKERTLELEKALEDVKKAKERVEELVKAEKERAGELKDARDVTLSVLEDTDEAKRELEKAKIDLEKAKGELEERVKERSAELEKAYKKLVKTEAAAAAADKARAEEAEKYRKEIEKAYEELKSLDKMKSDFISIAAHELRTPLTPVKAYVELIKAGKMGKIEWRQMEKLIAADKNIDLLAKLIDDMLDITRIEAGKMDIRKEELSVAEVVDIALDRVKLRFGERKRRISIYTPEDLPLIYGDRELMIKVFDNLLSNAIKYTPATTSKIRIEAEKEGKNIHVSVADTGIGILKKDLEKVFERFYLVDSSLTRRHRGIGLGLAITKGIVEEHGGKIWAESKGLGNGSTFHVVLPVMGKEK